MENSQLACCNAASTAQQSRLLLVSLLEKFCCLYETAPDRSQQLFYTICRALSAMQIIDQEWVQEMKSIRSGYQYAFCELISQAMDSIQKDECRLLDFPSDSLSSSFSTSFPGLSTFSTTPTFFSPLLKSQVNSRYHADFEQIAPIGRGAFGSVYSARHHLDGREYAVKKIRLSSMKAGEHRKDIRKKYAKMFREVKAMSRLDHKNVVRYYASWIEELWDHQNPKQMAKEKTDFDSIDLSLSSDESDAYDYRSDSGASLESSIFSTKSSNSDYSDQSYEVETISQRLSTTEKTESVVVMVEKPYAPQLYLFIQMKMCSTTLLKYISMRNKYLTSMTDKNIINLVDGDTNTRLFLQTISGVEYMHSQGVVHRDLKPGNVFLDHLEHEQSDKKPNKAREYLQELITANNAESWIVKIGDFGLATPKESEQLELVKKIDFTDADHTQTTGVGTVTYAAPEQIQPEPHTYAQTPADIYALGIIAFELYHPFQTAMERAIAISTLREKHELPEEFVRQWPRESAMILWMTLEKPEARPNIVDIKEAWQNNDMQAEDCESAEIAMLKQEISRLRSEVHKWKSIAQKLSSKNSR